jgi:hypothetical protein
MQIKLNIYIANKYVWVLYSQDQIKGGGGILNDLKANF